MITKKKHQYDWKLFSPQKKVHHCLFIFNFVFIIKGIIYISIGFNLRGSRTKDTEFKKKKKKENPLKTIKLSLNKKPFGLQKKFMYLFIYFLVNFYRILGFRSFKFYRGK